jgi:hypothetical protein
MDFCSLEIIIKKNHFNEILFFINHFSKRKIMWLPGSPLLKEERIKMVAFILFFMLDLGLFF